MKKMLIVISVVSVLIIGLIATTSMTLAAPPDHADHGNDFVCPVIASEAMGMHNPNAVPLGETGTYTVGQPTRHNINVPDQATNGHGWGVPGETEEPYAQSMPGDTDYTAIWNGDPIM